MRANTTHLDTHTATHVCGTFSIDGDDKYHDNGDGHDLAQGSTRQTDLAAAY